MSYAPIPTLLHYCRDSRLSLSRADFYCRRHIQVYDSRRFIGKKDAGEQRMDAQKPVESENRVVPPHNTVKVTVLLDRRVEQPIGAVPSEAGRAGVVRWRRVYKVPNWLTGISRPAVTVTPFNFNVPLVGTTTILILAKASPSGSLKAAVKSAAEKEKGVFRTTVRAKPVTIGASFTLVTLMVNCLSNVSPP